MARTSAHTGVVDRRERGDEAARRAAEAGLRAGELRAFLERLRAGELPTTEDLAWGRRANEQARAWADRAHALAAQAHADAVGRHLVEAVLAEVDGDLTAARFHRHFANVCEVLAQED
jgi:hypothetical protein